MVIKVGLSMEPGGVRLRIVKGAIRSVTNQRNKKRGFPTPILIYKSISKKLLDFQKCLVKLNEVSYPENRAGQAGQIGRSIGVIEPDHPSFKVDTPLQTGRPEWMDNKVLAVKDGKTIEIPIGVWLRDNISPHARGT